MRSILRRGEHAVMAKVSIIILFTTFFRRICQSFGSPGIISGLALSATKDGETYADYYPFFQHQFDMLQYFLFGSRDTVTTQKDKITTRNIETRLVGTKDEDYDHWWRRCIAVSAAMMRPAKYRLRRGR